MFTKICVPVDGSEGAWKALAAAKTLGEKYGSELLVLTISGPYSSLIMMQVAVNEQTITRTKEELKKARDTILGQAEERLAGYSGNVEYVETMGNPAQTIMKWAEEAGCDAIVMGSRGLSGVEEFLLGSVSEKVAQYAKVPVFIIK